MIASSIAFASGIRLAALQILVELLALSSGHTGTGVHVRDQRCFVAIAAVVSTAQPYRVVRVVTTGVREFDDDGTGTVAYCEPRDASRVRSARAAVDRKVGDIRQVAGQNVEHVVLRSTSQALVARQLSYVTAAGDEGKTGRAGVELIVLSAADDSTGRP
ncbi:MAG TPA: hypothetical protein VGM67_05525 [Gemmatimonadaceae bacterium]|jgi:hypothetical protein